MAKTVKASKELTKDKKVKAAFDLRPDLLHQLRYIALMDGKKQTDCVDEALTDYTAKWVKKNGEIPKK